MAKKMNSFSIRELILKGKNAVREYELPYGVVLVRPLSDLEIEDAQTTMFKYIRDPDTLKYVLEAESHELLNEGEKVEQNYNLDYAQLMEAQTAMILRVAYLAMRDFTDDEFSERDLKGLPGLKGLVQFVQSISGYSEEMIEEVENFREQP